jgi:hypothetical protein
MPLPKNLKNTSSIVQPPADFLFSTSIARLLAAENITVVFDATATTASFNIVKRILTLPNILTADKDVTDLFTSHEVGHAIYTDKEKYEEFMKKHTTVLADGTDFVQPALHFIVNVLEDARMEKLMKRKFPGLKLIYGKAYQKLCENDFFGLKKLNMKHDDEMYKHFSVVDRLNLYFKAGHVYSVPFDHSEKKYVDRTHALEDIDEMFAFAEELFDELPKVEMTMPIGSIQAGDAGQGAGKSGNNPAKGKPQKGQGQPGTGQGTPEAGDTESDAGDASAAGEGDDEAHEERDSNGNAHYDDFSDEDIDGTRKEVGSTQKSFDNAFARKAIKPQGKTTNAIFDFSESLWKDNFVSYKTFGKVSDAMTHYSDRIAMSKNLVNYLYKQFETHRRAHEYQKILPSKRGGLDPDRLFKYQFADDIFARKVQVQNTKNHGLVILIDLSGSMSGQIKQTIMLTLDLITFCQKAQIKYSVLGFCDGEVVASYNKVFPTKVSKQNTDYQFNSKYKLIEMFSSAMNRQEVANAANWISSVCANMTSWGGSSSTKRQSNDFNLGGTPLNEALLQMPSFIRDFRESNGVEIMNFITISDGDSNPLPLKGNSNYYGAGVGTDLMITDTVTKQTIIRRNALPYSTTESLLTVIRKVCNVKTACFYLCNTPSKDAVDIIKERDNSRHFTPIEGTHSYVECMGYDLMTFVSTRTVASADVNSIMKSLKFFIDVIA